MTADDVIAMIEAEIEESVNQAGGALDAMADDGHDIICLTEGPTGYQWAADHWPKLSKMLANRLMSLDYTIDQISEILLAAEEFHHRMTMFGINALLAHRVAGITDNAQLAPEYALEALENAFDRMCDVVRGATA